MAGPESMIIKLTQEVPGQASYVRRDRAIKAVEMQEDFMVETWIGWVQGRRGDYLVEICDTLRFPVSAAAFLKEYAPFDPSTVCDFCAEEIRRHARATAQR